MNLTKPVRLILIGLLLYSLSTLLFTRSFASEPLGEYDMAMYERPAFASLQTEEVFPEGLLELWTRALQRPDVELQRMVIDSMAIAHQRGLDGVETLRPNLREILQTPNQNVNLVRAAAHALIVLDSQTDAALLADIAIRRGGTVALVIEPALADWKSDAMKKVWLDRVHSLASTDSSTLMAMKGLGELGAIEASDRLKERVQQRRASARLRIEAARVLSQLDPPGLVELAQALQDDPSETNPLAAILAIELLKRQSGEDAAEILHRFIDHPDLAVQSGAITQLLRIDPNRVERHLDQSIRSRDVGVRLACVRSMIATQKPERIQNLAAMLDDENPSLRREVAAGLVDLAGQSNLREEVLHRAVDVLARDSWRGCEQAAVVLAKLDHEPAGSRLVELLRHERGEVKVAAAWGLTQLRVEGLLPAMLTHAQAVYDGFQSGELNDDMPGVSDQVAHLFIAMGDQRYAAAEPLMRAYLPKNFMIGIHSRAAAAWALGWIHEDDVQADLVGVMGARLNDTSSLEPELNEVRRMCAVSLGRMGAQSALPILRKNAGIAAPPARASDWAIEQITGEPVPVFPPRQTEIGGWFLSPIPKSTP